MRNVSKGALKKLEDLRSTISVEKFQFLQNIILHRQIDQRYLYDAAGCAHFTKLSQEEVYYLPFKEREIFERWGTGIMTWEIDRPQVFIEYGPGNGKKASYLLSRRPNFTEDWTYVAVDISEDYLQEAVEFVKEESDVQVKSHVSDMLTVKIERDVGAAHTACLLGSTVGQLSPNIVASFLKNTRNYLKECDRFLLAFDSNEKSAEVMNRAYNGHTKYFNLNTISSVNNRFGTNLNLENFDHSAYFDPLTSKVFISLLCTQSQEICINGDYIDYIEAGEHIETISSYKYSREFIMQVAREAGFTPMRFWHDDLRWYYLAELVVEK